MRETLQVLLQLRSEGRLGRFAIGGAIERPFHDLAVPVVSAEHLCAIALQTGRPKDFLRVHSLIEAGCVDAAVLARMVEKHGLSGRWSVYARRYA